MATAISSATNDAAEIITRDKGQKGLTGDDGIDGAGFNQVRQSLLDSPLCRLFAPNDIAPVVAGSLTATRSTTGTYIDRYGVVKTASADEMREESEGWLIEGESTNLLLQSDDPSNASWDKVGSASVVANNQQGADGQSNTASTITIGATGGNNRLSQNVSFTDNTSSATVTFIVKDININYVNIRIFQSGGTIIDSYADFNLASKTWSGLVNVTADQLRYKLLANGYYQLSLTADCNNTNSLLSARISGGIGDSSTGDFIFYAAQLEQQSGPSSYIPTTTAPVTRAADLLSIPVHDNLFSGVFSIVCNFALNNFEGSSSSYILRILPSTDIDLRINVQTNGQIRLGYNNLFSVKNTTSKSSAVLIFDGLNIISYSDGVAGASATSAAIIENENDLVIGSSSTTGANPLNGHLKDFRIYDFALNEDEIKYLAGVV